MTLTVGPHGLLVCVGTCLGAFTLSASLLMPSFSVTLQYALHLELDGFKCLSAVCVENGGFLVFLPCTVNTVFMCPLSSRICGLRYSLNKHNTIAG